jgi:uncharacterized protein YuzE
MSGPRFTYQTSPPMYQMTRDQEIEIKHSVLRRSEYSKIIAIKCSSLISENFTTKNDHSCRHIDDNFIVKFGSIVEYGDVLYGITDNGEDESIIVRFNEDGKVIGVRISDENDVRTVVVNIEKLPYKQCDIDVIKNYLLNNSPEINLSDEQIIQKFIDNECDIVNTIMEIVMQNLDLGIQLHDKNNDFKRIR